MVGLLVVLFVPPLLSFLAMPGLCCSVRVTHAWAVRVGLQQLPRHTYISQTTHVRKCFPSSALSDGTHHAKAGTSLSCWLPRSRGCHVCLPPRPNLWAHTRFVDAHDKGKEGLWGAMRRQLQRKPWIVFLVRPLVPRPRSVLNIDTLACLIHCDSICVVQHRDDRIPLFA